MSVQSDCLMDDDDDMAGWEKKVSLKVLLPAVWQIFQRILLYSSTELVPALHLLLTRQAIYSFNVVRILKSLL